MSFKYSAVINYVAEDIQMIMTWFFHRTYGNPHDHAVLVEIYMLMLYWNIINYKTIDRIVWMASFV